MELQARDLRINNLVNRTNKLTKEKLEIELTASCILDISANGKMSSFIYEPIPLTEEWLLNFGANKNRNQLYFGNGKILFSWLGSTEITLDIEGQCIDIYCEYVHQLQNLYFALTNQELSI